MSDVLSHLRATKASAYHTPPPLTCQHGHSLVSASRHSKDKQRGVKISEETYYLFGNKISNQKLRGGGNKEREMEEDMKYTEKPAWVGAAPHLGEDLTRGPGRSWSEN